MIPANKPSDEATRLARLQEYQILDTGDEQAFEDIALLAAQIMGTPMSAVSFVDQDRQYFKSRRGLGARETSRDCSFCAHTILTPNEVMVVPDAHNDLRFCLNPLVTGDPNIRFYAGAPLLSQDGVPLGALCVIDNQPRDPTPEQLEALRALSRQVTVLLETRINGLRMAQQVGEVKHRDELLNKAGRMAQLGVWQLDVDNQMLDWSEQVCSIYEVAYGFRPRLDQAINFFAPAERPLIRDAVDRGVRDGTPWDLRLQLITARGRRAWVRVMGEPEMRHGRCVRIWGIIQDITEQVVARERIEANERRLRFALETSNTGLWDLDLLTHTVQFTDTWYTMLGYDPSELPMTENTWHTLCHPDEHHDTMKAVDDYVAGRTPIFRHEYRMKAKDGSWKWVLDMGRIIEFASDGRPRRMIGVHIDIHDLKLAQDQLAQARDAAQAANRAKSEFLANMSHEIRTPMTAILGFTELLRDPDQTHEQLADRVAIIRRNGEHLLHMINDVLDLSKIEADRMTLHAADVDPRNVIDETMDLLTLRARDQGVELIHDEADLLPAHIKADAMRLRQILINLVGNAIKFTEKGRVTIKSEMREVDGVASQLVMRVIDTGIGMTEEQMTAIFKPFQQADSSTARRFGGTGLGLSISTRLAAMMNGQLEVKSRVGEGSTFTLTLDLSGQSIQLAPRRTMRIVGDRRMICSISGMLTGLRVLLAEDGPDNQRLIRFQLEKASAIVTVVPNGRAAIEAIEQAANLGEPFHVLVSDMQMPVMDGYEAISELRHRGHRLPIVALTAHAMTGDREKCLAIGCNEYATKPINAPELVMKVRTVALADQALAA